jgi:hypothetical protein
MVALSKSELQTATLAQILAQQNTNDDLKRSTKMRNGDRPGNAVHILRCSTDQVRTPTARLQRGEWIAVLLTAETLCRAQEEFEFSGTGSGLLLFVGRMRSHSNTSSDGRYLTAAGSVPPETVSEIRRYPLT